MSRSSLDRNRFDIYAERAKLRSKTLTSHKVTRKLQHFYSGIRAEYFGDWIKFDKLLKYLNRGDIKRDAAKAQRDFLLQYKWALINGLETSGESNRRPFAPWSSFYYGSDRTGPGIGRRSETYLMALYSLRIVSSGYMVRLEFPSGVMQQKSPDAHGKVTKGAHTLARYALTFELGTTDGKQPPRPLWSDTLDYMGGSQTILNKVSGAIGKRLSGMGINFKYE
jgi:hypothetical protein